MENQPKTEKGTRDKEVALANAFMQKAKVIFRLPSFALEDILEWCVMLVMLHITRGLAKSIRMERMERQWLTPSSSSSTSTPSLALSLWH